jgi:hypothetical protein
MLLKLKPRYRWFSNTSPDADEGWFGPHKTIEAAVTECVNDNSAQEVFVGQGYRMTKAEREDWNVDFEWQVDTRTLIKVQPL